jgi:hypothetical protein
LLAVELASPPPDGVSPPPLLWPTVWLWSGGDGGGCGDIFRMMLLSMQKVELGCLSFCSLMHVLCQISLTLFFACCHSPEFQYFYEIVSYFI